MPADFLHWLARRFGRPASAGAAFRPFDHTVDVRLDRVEREQRQIEARLELLERQADPRRLRRDD